MRSYKIWVKPKAGDIETTFTVKCDGIKSEIGADQWCLQCITNHRIIAEFKEWLYWVEKSENEGNK